jgi:hypothetical protein
MTAWAPCLALLLAAAPPAPASERVVPLDLASGTLARRLPFDVPFVIEGTAPPGTSRVSLEVRVTRAGGTDASQPFAPAAVSGTDALGRFRLPMPAIPPDRTVELLVAVERSLTEHGRRLFRLDAEALLRNELLPGRVADAGVDARLREGLLAAFRRGLSEGRAAGEPPGERTLTTPYVLFDPAATPEQAAAELARLSRELRAARDELERSERRHDEALASLAGAIAEVAADGALGRAVGTLQARPELDPRNPRSPLALSEEARALAAGNPPEALPIAGAGPAQLAAAREAHRREGRAIRELREFAQTLAASGSRGRSQTGALAETVALADDSRQALARALADGAYRRAESWASVLEDYTADAERAMAAGDRALATLLAELEATASAVVVRERVTVVGSTEAGLYASLDLGVLYGFEADAGAAYAAFSLSLAPVDKAAPLRGAALRRRLSVIVGLTLTDMKKDGDERFENLVGERWNVVAGVGVRVTGSLRVGAGALLLLKNDPNPLVDDRSLAAVPYVSASLDVDVGRLFGGGER